MPVPRGRWKDESEMSDEISARNVTKFNGTNYQGWKFQLNSLLTAYGIREVVSGEKPRPQGAGQEAILKTWLKENARAMFLISSSMEYEQLEALLVCNTAKEMWDKLSSIHEQRSASNKLMLTQKFHEYRMCSGDSVTQHIAKVQNMASKLVDVGEQVSEIMIIAKVLASLSPKYAMLQTAWDSVDPARQTLENLQERLIREEARLTLEDESPGAFSAYKKNSANRKSEAGAKDKIKVQKPVDREKAKCFKCKKIGHFARECKKDKKDKRDNSETRESRDCAFVAEKQRNKQAFKSESHGLEVKVVNEVLNTGKQDVWIMDSGASRHITHRREWFSTYQELLDGGTISLGDNKECKVIGEGTIPIEKFVDGAWRDSRIEKVLYVPKMKKNLFSVGVCTSRGNEVNFYGNCVQIKKHGQVCATGVKQINEIYRMLFRVRQAQAENEVNVSEANLRVWHERLGHMNSRAVQELVKNGLVNGVKLTNKNEVFCESCKMGKSHRRVFNKVRERAMTVPGEVFHTDVCGPMSVETPGGARYLLIFKDDATSFRYIYFLRHKNDVFEKLKVLDKLIENKFGRVMRVLRSDNGREFRNSAIDKYLEIRGIQRECTAPYTPEQNGRAERDNRTIIESARTMLFAKDLPLSLWAEAANTAVYLMNRSGSSSEQGRKTPYELWMKRKPDLKHLRIFGTEAFVNIPKQMTKKLDMRAKRMILVGYEGESSNYRLYDPATKKVTVSRDVEFKEEIGAMNLPARDEETDDEIKLPKSGSSEYEREEEESDNEDDVFIPTDEDEAVLEERSVQGVEAVKNRNLRDRASIKPPSRYDSNVAEYHVPFSYEEAMKSSKATKWMSAIKEELKAHKENETWKLVERKPNVKTIDSRWVFRIIKDTEGNVVRFKARLCARGFKQKQGIDFMETWAPVVRYDSLRVLLAIVAAEDLELAQFDVQTAFLHGKLDEKIFMEVPEGLSVKIQSESEKKSVVCLLKKSLYGLKQAPRCWNKKIQ